MRLLLMGMRAQAARVGLERIDVIEEEGVACVRRGTVSEAERG